MKKIFLTGLVLACFAMNANASCIVEVDRTPCPGKKDEAYHPYDGANPTKDDKKAKITTEKDCKAELEKNCKIVRRDVLSKKVVWGSWDGKQIADKKLCDSNEKLKKESNSDCTKP